MSLKDKPPVIVAGTVVICLMSAWAYLSGVTPEESVREVIRWTARLSLVLFSTAFLASSLQRLRPSPAGKWLLRNRRSFGLSFALSHAAHLAAIVALGNIVPGFWASVGATTWFFGGGAYICILLMVITSFDAVADRLGTRAWKILHKTGGYWIWFVFWSSNAPEAIKVPIYVPFALLATAIPVVRFAAYRKSKRRVAEPAHVA